MSKEDKTKLNNIAYNANNYSLPLASSTTRGGIKIGYSSQSANNRPVQLNSEKAYVNIPDATTSQAGLMTVTDKNKLDNSSVYKHVFTGLSALASSGDGWYHIVDLGDTEAAIVQISTGGHSDVQLVISSGWGGDDSYSLNILNSLLRGNPNYAYVKAVRVRKYKNGDNGYLRLEAKLNRTNYTGATYRTTVVSVLTNANHNPILTSNVTDEKHLLLLVTTTSETLLLEINLVDLAMIVKNIVADNLATVATSGNYNDLKNRPSIPSETTETTVANWGFTKNTGTYSKPVDGIPVADLHQDILESLNDLEINAKDSEVDIAGTTINLTNVTATIPAATIEKAGVMTAKDKIKLDNLVIEGTDVDLNTYFSEGVYFFSNKKLTNVPILNDSVVSARLTVLTAYDGTSPVITQVLNLNHLSGGEGNIYIRSHQNGSWKPWGKLQTNVEVEQIVKEAEEKLEEKISNEKTALINGDTIVGQAREVYSRTGKVDSATFLKRTTAGGTSVSDGVASVKQIGGNIVKNYIGEEIKNDGRLTVVKNGNITNITVNNPVSAGVSNILFTVLPINVDHKYYCRCLVNSDYRVAIYVNSGYGSNPVAAPSTESGWRVISGVVANPTISDDYYKDKVSMFLLDYVETLEIGESASFANPLLIDLTEMFGTGNEPTKEECDTMFACMGALPQGLTVAQPTAFKSVGYNQFNPENVLKGKTVDENGAIVDNSTTDIAVVPCLPCKVGVGENNGYCVHGEFEDSDIKVYLTPLNPMEVEGELYMHELTPDATKGTYVPLIKGYMLIVTPSTHDLCCHFLWGEDRDKHDYEPYMESIVELPVIPQMSEWGLAGMNVSEKPLYDIVDVANNLYVKRIKRIDLGSITWNKTNRIWHRFVNGDVSVYAPYTILSRGYIYSQPNYISQYRLSTTAVYDAENNTITYNGVVYSFAEAITQTYAITYNIAVGTKLSGDNFCANIICANYPTMTRGQMAYGTTYKCIGCYALNPAIYDPAFSEMTNEEIQQSLSGVMAYYEISNNAYEEYPITVIDNNYIGSDYGVEEFTGSKIPLVANILFYMRSLVGETRNFIDQLYTNTQKTDAKEVADYITNGIEGNKQLATEAPNLALRALYITAGAEYNDSGEDKTKTAPWGETVTHKAGHYYLNGLGDITETQMRYIYNRGHFNDKDVSPLGYSAIGRFNAIRTNLPRAGMWNASLQPYLCASNNTIEVVNLHVTRGTEKDTCVISFTDTESIFAGSSKLSVVDVRCILSGTWLSSSFKNCSSLQEIRVRYLRNNIIFAQSPLLSKATVLYMIQNATPTSAITITLHPDAYSRLADDADIVAALNEKNGYIDEEGNEIAGTLPAGASINLVSA